MRVRGTPYINIKRQTVEPLVPYIHREADLLPFLLSSASPAQTRNNPLPPSAICISETGPTLPAWGERSRLGNLSKKTHYLREKSPRLPGKRTVGHFFVREFVFHPPIPPPRDPSVFFERVHG